MLDVSDLHMVETICAAGSLTRAADALHISQPTLSKRLARLEQQLNTRLFHRGPTGLKPTLIASYLIESSTQIKASVASVERQVERLLAHDKGDLRIGVGPIIEQVLLPRVLIDFAQQTGDVRLSVVTDRADLLFAQLIQGRLDVIAGPFNPNDPAYVEHGVDSIELVKEKTINVARSAHPIFNDPDASDFLSYPYASPPRQGTMLTERFAHDRPRISADNYTLLKMLMLETDYICGGPREIFRAELSSGKLREIENTPSIEWQSACLFKSESIDTPLVNLFVETIKMHRDNYLAGSSIN